MRKIFDTLVIYLLKWCFSWLFRQYDIFFDGVELWISDKLPDIQDVLPEIPDVQDDFFVEE